MREFYQSNRSLMREVYQSKRVAYGKGLPIKEICQSKIKQEEGITADVVEDHVEGQMFKSLHRTRLFEKAGE
jgi:hypothetical protein